MEHKEALEIIRSRRIEISPEDNRTVIEIAEQIAATGSPAIKSTIEVEPVMEEIRFNHGIEIPRLEKVRSYFAG